jgi:hypothetical protein
LLGGGFEGPGRLVIPGILRRGEQDQGGEEEEQGGEGTGKDQ